MARKFYGDVEIKSSLEVDGSLTLSTITGSRALTSNGSGVVTASATTDTELGYVSGVTSAIQTQLNAKASATDLSNHISDTTTHGTTGDIVGTSDTQTLTNKTIDADSNTITNIENADIKAGAAIAVNKLAALTANRAVATDGSGFISATAVTDTELGYVSGVTSSLQTQLDAKASIAYVDAAIAGLAWKDSVRALADSQTALSGGATLTLDGVSIANGDRVLLTAQTAGEENGPYLVSGIGTAYSLARTSDANTAAEVLQLAVFIEEGTLYADSAWVNTTNAPITLGTTPLVFAQFSGAGSIVAGAGLTKTGNTLDVVAGDDSLTVAADSVVVKRDAAGAVGLTASGVKVNVDNSGIEIATNSLQLKDTAATPGSFGSATQVATYTVDQKGRLTASGNTSIAIPSTAVTDFDEAAQDAVGTILVDSSSIDFTYTDATPSITAVVLPAGVDHDALANFVANEHIDHSGVSISGAANGGLAGGGDITASRTLSVDITNATAETAADNADLVLIYDNSATALRKMTRANFLSGSPTSSAGDINETSFAMTNNQAAAADITGFAFAAGVVRSFSAHCSVFRDATSDLYEEFHIEGINKGTLFDISVSSLGDDAGITFSITTAGQVQYTSSNLAGHTASTFKFRAITTSV